MSPYYLSKAYITNIVLICSFKNKRFLTIVIFIVI